MNIKIIIAAHKPYDFPVDGVYVPLFVGANGREDIINPSDNTPLIRDDSGDNISAKNPYYSELTGLYWAWKNLEADYIGLAHYRRHFFYKSEILGEEDVKLLLRHGGIIVPKKRHYYIESLYSHYGHTLDASHLDIARRIIEEHYTEYMPSVVEVYSRTWGYMWNMSVMPRWAFDEYCQWIFDILSRMEDEINLDELKPFEARLFGRVSEILFDVWLNKNIDRLGKIIELPVKSMEPVPWGKKISAFLSAKFLGKKYKESF